MPLSCSEKDEIAATGIKLCRAILTLAKVPDPDRRFVYGSQTYWPECIRDFNEAYGWDKEKVSVVQAHQPTPKEISTYLETLNLLTWLEANNMGKRDSKIIVARAYRISWWRIGDEHSRDERTVRRWYKSAIELLHNHEKRLKTNKKVGHFSSC